MRFFIVFGTTILFFSCAQPLNPAGGPKDIKPPRAIKYIPDSAAKNFSAKNIVIVFDEYIQLNDIQKQLVISPPMSIQPEVKAKGKILLVELKDSLRKNTTYTFNFGNSIRDFTEANAKEDFQYVFSTGSYIDSLKLSGTVKNAFDLKTDKGILVMLYDTYEDSVPCKKLPSYFTKTKGDGSYKINNIRPGTYKAFSLKDVNNNYLYDVPAENIAFSDSLIKIAKNTKLDLQMFKEEPKKQRMLKNFVRGYGSIFLAYTKPVTNISYKPMNSGTKTETFLSEFNERRDTVQVWFPAFGNDSLHFKVMVDDNAIDTLKICTCLFDKAKQGRGEAFKLNAIINVKKDQLFDYTNDISLKFNHPINNAKTNEINLTSNGNKINFTNTIFSDSIKRNFLFHYPLIQDSSYQLFIPPAVFTDIFGLASDTIKLDFRAQEEKYYGTLKLTLKMKSKIKYILQLMNEKGEVFDCASSNKGVFSYQYLSPGSYKLRIIHDKNGDDKWTTGNYFEKKKPETVIYYPSPITIRSNWDLELDWKVE